MLESVRPDHWAQRHGRLWSPGQGQAQCYCEQTSSRGSDDDGGEREGWSDVLEYTDGGWAVLDVTRVVTGQRTLLPSSQRGCLVQERHRAYVTEQRGGSWLKPAV